MATLNLLVFVAAARQWHRLRQLRRRTRTKGFHQLLDHQPPTDPSALTVTSQAAAAAVNHCIEPADEVFGSSRANVLSDVEKRPALMSSVDAFQTVTDQLVDAWLLHNSSYTDGDVSSNQEVGDFVRRKIVRLCHRLCGSNNCRLLCRSVWVTV